MITIKKDRPLVRKYLGTDSEDLSVIEIVSPFKTSRIYLKVEGGNVVKALAIYAPSVTEERKKALNDKLNTVSEFNFKVAQEYKEGDYSVSLFERK